jgi:hypothetical protein
VRELGVDAIDELDLLLSISCLIQTERKHFPQVMINESHALLELGQIVAHDVDFVGALLLEMFQQSVHQLHKFWNEQQSIGDKRVKVELGQLLEVIIPVIEPFDLILELVVAGSLVRSLKILLDVFG